MANAPLLASPFPAGTHEPEEASGAYLDLLKEHLLDTLYGQALFSKHVARGRDWNMSLDPNDHLYGRLGFGRKDYYACQILGSESFQSGTWLWSDANESIPKDMQTLTRELRSQFQHIPEFSQPQVSLNLVQGHELAMIACGVLGHPCYYAGPNGSVGRVLYVLTDPSLHTAIHGGDSDVDELVLSVGRAGNLDLFTITLEWIESFLKKHGASDAEVQTKKDGAQDFVYRFPPRSKEADPPAAIVSLDKDGDVTGIRTPSEDTDNEENNTN